MNNKIIKLLYSCAMFIFAYIIVVIKKVFRLSTRKTPLWLIAEQRGMARDNGIAFYNYCMSIPKDKLNVFYVIGYKSPDYNSIVYKSNLIKFYSLKHYIYYIEADALIMCFPDSICPSLAIERFLRRAKLLHNKKIYLKHGIIKDDLPMLHANNFTTDMISTASEREKKFIDQNFGHPSSVTKLIGLTRYDQLTDQSDKNNEMILVMPTWRRYIKHDFANSEFCKRYQSLINRISNLTQDSNVTTYFYLHNNFQKYSDVFQDAKNVRIITQADAKVGDLLKACNLLITDYSSVAFDFAYMQKPIIYYQFDISKVRSHHYSNGYFDYVKDGFGPVFQDEKRLIEYLKLLQKKNLENPEKYLSRSRTFYAFRDQKNCKRTYDAIMELTQGIKHA